MGSVSSIILIIAVMVLGLLLALGLQFWRISRSPMGRVVRITNNIKFNEKLSRGFGDMDRVAKFKTGAWFKSKDRVTFLPEDLHADLDAIFHDISEINEQIEAAMKYKSDDYVRSIDVSDFIEPLSECREDLQAWITENLHNPDYLPKKHSIFRIKL